MMTSAALSPIPLSALNEDERSVLGAVGEVVVFSLPMNVKFRGITERQGLLLRGPSGWGECSPFWDYGPAESSRWLKSGLASAQSELGFHIRDSVPVNLTVPVCTPEVAVLRVASQPGCKTAKVKVADPGSPLVEDVARVRAVAQELARRYGAEARVRVDANAVWTVAEAKEALEQLNEAAESVGGLEYAEQPVSSTEELAQLRQLLSVPLAADESIRRASNPLQVRQLEAADLAILKVAPLGGVASARNLSEQLGLPTVVSSALDSSIGIAAGVELAASLPQLEHACGLNTVTLFAADVVDRPLIATEGSLSTSEARAVLGGELTSVAKAVPADVVGRWTERLSAMASVLVKEQS